MACNRRKEWWEKATATHGTAQRLAAGSQRLTLQTSSRSSSRFARSSTATNETRQSSVLREGWDGKFVARFLHSPIFPDVSFVVDKLFLLEVGVD